jgi:hypothetical protein
VEGAVPSGRYLTGPALRRGAFIFLACCVISPALSHYFGSVLIDSSLVRASWAGLGGMLGYLVGIAIDGYYFPPKQAHPSRPSQESTPPR